MGFLDLFSPGGRRRRRVRKAADADTLAPDQYTELVVSLLAPPELVAEDVPPFHDLLGAGVGSLDGSWPLEAIHKTLEGLSRLSQIGDVEHDLGRLYFQLADKLWNLGHKKLSTDAAIQGYKCPQALPASKADNVVLLARREQIDEPVKRVYRAFLADNPPSSQQGQRLVGVLRRQGEILPEMSRVQAQHRLPLITCITELLPARGHLWARNSIGIGQLILGRFQAARQCFVDVLATDPTDLTAIQGMVVALVQMQQPERCVQVLRAARLARVDGPIMDSAEALGQAAAWLAAPSVVDRVRLKKLASWYAALQRPFPVSRLAQPQLEYVIGQLAAITGKWSQAKKHLQAAYEMSPRDIRLGHAYIQTMQISGEWARSAKALEAFGDTPPELACLRLAQLRHDLGLDKLIEKHGRATSQLDSRNPWERLESAEYALLSGQPETVLPWPDSPVPGNALQSDTWTRIWVSSLVGQGRLQEASAQMERAPFLRLSKPVRLFLTAAAQWQSGDTPGAAGALKQTLRMAPRYDQALRLAASLAESQGNTQRADEYLKSLLAVAPKDRGAALRQALLSWNTGDEATSVTQLRALLKYGGIAPRANYWLGRIMLAKGARDTDARTLEQAGIHLRKANESRVAEAAWYEWLGQVHWNRASRAGWTTKEARRLLQELPCPLGEIPVPEVAQVAAILAIETGTVVDMLAGARLLLDLEEGDRESGAAHKSDVFSRNMVEALWRIAELSTTADQRLELVDLSRRFAALCPEEGEAVGRLADSMALHGVIDLVETGESLDLALSRVEAIVEASFDALLPRLVRAKILVQRGQLDEERARRLFDPEGQESIARSLEELVWATSGSDPVPARPLGLGAFLTQQSRALSRPEATLKTMAAEAISNSDSALQLELAHCMACLGQNVATELYSHIYQADPRAEVAKEFSDYLCHIAAQWGTPDGERMGIDAESARELLGKARALIEAGQLMGSVARP
jgi:tetratricopeptide (TPR) repeat protein